MMAEFNPHPEASAQAPYEVNADESTKRKCRARRDYYKQVNTKEKLLFELQNEIAEKKAKIAELEEHIKQLEQKV